MGIFLHKLKEDLVLLIRSTLAPYWFKPTSLAKMLTATPSPHSTASEYLQTHKYTKSSYVSSKSDLTPPNFYLLVLNNNPKMASSNYTQIPAKALKKPEPFKIEIPHKEIEHLKQLLRLSRLPKPTYESLRDDGRFGVSHKWMSEAKRVWEEFDW